MVIMSVTILSPRSAQRRSLQRAWAANALTALAGLGFGITLLLAVTEESWSGLHAAGGIATALGRLAGLAGAYGMLLVLLLAARLPALERSAGQDRLIGWHRRLAPYTLFAIAAHGVLIAVGYAQAAHTGVLHEAWTILSSYQWMVPATLGFGMLVAAGVTSYRRARRRLSHETWWTIHLYTYLGLALAFVHQITTGAAFVGHPLAQAWWIAIWGVAVGAVVAFRVGLPVARSLRHGLRVSRVDQEAPGVVSITLEGRDVHRLPVAGGHFAHWRFLTREHWSQAHPFSFSAMPRGNRLRITVKDQGDHTRRLADLEPGTPVALEGPYGAFTVDARRTDRVLLIGAGVGAAVLPALIEDLPPQVDIIVINRASRREDLVLHDEISHLVREHGGQVIELVGSRDAVPMDAGRLGRLVPDIRQRDIYICGPELLATQIAEDARDAGVPPEQIHHETFAY
jgi:predicted ferric reductase